MATYSGACLCGGVKLEVSNPKGMGACHCTRCQRWSGSSSSTVLIVGQKDLKVVQGQDLVKTYTEGDFGPRSFCSKCGSSLYASGGDNAYVSASAIKDHGMKIGFHIQVAYKAPWDEIGGSAPQFPEWPPHG